VVKNDLQGILKRIYMTCNRF